MSANINKMFYAGEKPWHNFGVKVDQELDSNQALIKSGQDFVVEMLPTYIPIAPKVDFIGGEEPIKYIETGDYAAVRQDNKVIFNSGLSKGYVPLQNKDAFKFMDTLLNDASAKYHTAGSLGEDERVWILAKFPGSIRIKGTDDLTDKFLLVSNSHNGTTGVRISVTPIRVVCQNTLNAAESNAKFFSIYHTKNVMNKISEVQASLGLIVETFNKTEEIYNQLAGKFINRVTLEGILNALIPLKENDDNETIKLQHNQITELFEDNDNNAFPQIKGTMWSFYNAITRYVDHVKMPYGNAKHFNSDRKTNSLLFGTDYKLKQRGFELCLADL